jgi:hypothetical protein
MTPSARDLFPPRLATRALRLALEAADVAPLCMVFASDDPSQVFPTPHVAGAADIGFRFADDWRGNSSQAPLATVILLAPVPAAGEPPNPLSPPRARVTVPCLDDIIRPTHLDDWDRDALGLGAGTAADPDLDVEIDLSELLASEGELLASAPPRLDPRPRFKRVVRVLMGKRTVTCSLRRRR